MQLIAADLGFDASFVEKDWHAMRIIAALIAVNTSSMRLVFSGGTALSKGFGLIQRFSEDLDFKVILPATGFNRDECRNYRHQIVDAIRKGSSDWSLNDEGIKSRNKGRFFNCQIAYQQNFTPAATLRPHIKLEVTFKPPALPFEEKPLQSFIAQAMGQRPEVPTIACVSPVETAADKLSALTWRVLFWLEQAHLTITLLPGSRSPEAYANWQQILVAVAGLCDTFSERSSAISARDRTQFKLRTFTPKSTDRRFPTRAIAMAGTATDRGIG